MGCCIRCSGALAKTLSPDWIWEVRAPSADYSGVRLYSWDLKDIFSRIFLTILFWVAASVAMLLLPWLLWISWPSKRQLFKHKIDKSDFLKLASAAFSFCQSSWQSLCLSLCYKAGYKALLTTTFCYAVSKDLLSQAKNVTSGIETITKKKKKKLKNYLFHFLEKLSLSL